MVNKFVLNVVASLALLTFAKGQAMQQGTLILTNSSGADSAVRLITELEDCTLGTVVFKAAGKRIVMPSLDSNEWTLFAPGKSLEINTPISLSAHQGGHGSIWGKVVELYILNRRTNRANKFLLSKISEYSLAKDDQNNLLLIGKEGNIYAQ